MPITTGVKYIKINRYDTNGRDNTNSLQELTQIKIKYSDINIITYPITSITEYPNYYLYQVYTTNSTSSVDNNIDNYKLSVNTGSQFRAQTTVFPVVFSISTVVTDSMGWFNTSSFKYELNNLPNIPISVSFKTTCSVGSPTLYLCKESADDSAGSIGTILSSGTGTSISLSYNGYFTGGDRICIRYGSIGVDFSSSVSELILTQSSTPVDINDLVVLEPYLTNNFANSDCNVLLNNVDKYPYNPLYMDVDYSLNPIIATNSNQIISGSALKSTVKQYYYSLIRHINPRYNGTRVNSAFYNLYTTSSTIYFINGDSGSYTGDISYGKTPNIEYESSALFEFSWAGSTYPEIYGAGAFYLGNIINVEEVTRANRRVNDNSGKQRREVELISPSNIKIYDYTINNDLYPNTQVRAQQYETSIKISSNLRVIANDFSVPGVSSYMICNTNSSSIAFQHASIDNIITFLSASEVTINNNFYTKGPDIMGSEMIPEISESITNGDRWFITIYKNLSSPISGTLKPYNYKRNYIDAFGNYRYPLQNKGVYEIQSTSGSDSIILTSDLPKDTNNDPLEFGSGSYGVPSLPQKTMLIWKAINPGRGQNKYIIVNGDTLSGVGKGALSKLYVKDDIKNYFGYITSVYGTNPKNNLGNITNLGGGGGRG